MQLDPIIMWELVQLLTLTNVPTSIKLTLTLNAWKTLLNVSQKIVRSNLVWLSNAMVYQNWCVSWKQMFFHNIVNAMAM
jgi:hypothetical protein